MVKRPFANFYGLNFVLYALSTPFLNLHWFFDKFNMTGSRAQLFNGIALLTTFFCSRILWGNYQSICLYSDMWAAQQIPSVEILLANNTVTPITKSHPDLRYVAGESAATINLPMWLACIYLGSNTVLNILNIYWFGKMIQAVRKRFQPPNEKPILEKAKAE
jgi:TLC domain